MFKNIISGLCAMGIASAALLGPSEALAYRAPAALGFNLDGNAQRALLANWENPIMIAGATVYVPVVLSAFKNYALTGRMKGNGQNATWCWGARVDGANAVVWSAGGSTTSASYVSVSLGSLNVVAGTSLMFECDLPQAAIGARPGVNAFDWT